ncbi:MAG: hypothetical protein AAGC81_18300 [Pseudomonadota bacterium]
MLRSALLFTLFALPAQAGIAAKFVEDAPKDRFRIVNTSACPTGPLEVTIDLSTSPAGLIFDTTGSGAGVNVFQPFRIIAGGENVESAGEITDGDSAAVLTLSTIPAKGNVVFTIDVDDTLESSSNGQTMISGSEIEGAELRVQIETGKTYTANFDRIGDARLPWEACIS